MTAILTDKLSENLAAVRDRIERAANRAGRDAVAVRLVAVTKQVAVETTRALVELGVGDLGESRPQELWRKHDALDAIDGDASVRWHLIGPLQKNKARRTLPLVSLVHSVDSLALLERLDELAAELNLSRISHVGWDKLAENEGGPSQANKARIDTGCNADILRASEGPPQSRLARPTLHVAEKYGQCPDVLLEVNVSGEAVKHGFAPDELLRVIESAGQLHRVCVAGLMTMAPFDDDPERARPTFAGLRELRDRLRLAAPPNCPLAELSMGMSGDFEVAIEEAATIVRIGSALFQGVTEDPA